MNLLKKLAGKTGTAPATYATGAGAHARAKVEAALAERERLLSDIAEVETDVARRVQDMASATTEAAYLEATRALSDAQSRLNFRRSFLVNDIEKQLADAQRELASILRAERAQAARAAEDAVRAAATRFAKATAAYADEVRAMEEAAQALIAAEKAVHSDDVGPLVGRRAERQSSDLEGQVAGRVAAIVTVAHHAHGTEPFMINARWLCFPRSREQLLEAVRSHLGGLRPLAGLDVEAQIEAMLNGQHHALRVAQLQPDPKIAKRREFEARAERELSARVPHRGRAAHPFSRQDVIRRADELERAAAANDDSGPEAA